MSQKKPTPVLEVVFERKGINPWDIPFPTVSNTIKAVQQLALGSDSDEEEEPDQGHRRLQAA